MKSAARFFVSVVAASMLFGCGVARSTTAILKAQQEYQTATMSTAKTVAPYEFVLGEEYLRKAKEEAGYSDYQVAERLALRAQALLNEATRLAVIAETGSAPPLETGLEE